MTCHDVREKLLNLEHPDLPGATLGKHAQECGDCRRWLRRLVRLERALPRLPLDVPPPPASLFAAIEGQGTLVRPRLHLHPEGRKEFGRRKLALASALAASLALFALGFWAWSGFLPAPEPTPLAELNKRMSQKLAGVWGAPQRVEALAGLAHDLLEEAATADVTGTERLAGQFEHLLAEEVPAQARGLRIGELEQVLEKLARTESRASRLATTHKGKKAAAYARMALAARKAELKLRART